MYTYTTQAKCKNTDRRTFRNTAVGLYVKLLRAPPKTCYQNAFRPKDTYRTEGTCVEKNPTTNFQTLKETADCQILTVK